MGNVKKMIMFVVGLLITIAVIAYSLGYFTKSKNLSSAVDSGMNDMQVSLQASRFTGYDTGSTVSGTQALNAIRTFASGTFTVTVKTKSDTTGKSYTSPTAYTITDISNVDYIEPTSNFTCTLNKSANGTANALVLVQN
jgi:hypothetical protein